MRTAGVAVLLMVIGALLLVLALTGRVTPTLAAVLKPDLLIPKPGAAPVPTPPGWTYGGT